MTPKHLRIRISQLLTLAEASNCPRRKFGAMLIDPSMNIVLTDGYNGGPRGGGRLCGGETCQRDDLGVQSGTRYEIGCHHAEMNALMNAARRGIATDGSWMIVTGEPCVLCAKLMHHAGVVQVVCVQNGFLGPNGTQYLKEQGIAVKYVSGPQDPRI